LISDWCAKIYEHDKGWEHNNGWEKVVGETSQLDLTEDEEDQFSSVRIRPGCDLNFDENYCTCTEDKTPPPQPPRPGN
jgi:hypothetical protein